MFASYSNSGRGAYEYESRIIEIYCSYENCCHRQIFVKRHSPNVKSIEIKMKIHFVCMVVVVVAVVVIAY